MKKYQIVTGVSEEYGTFGVKLVGTPDWMDYNNGFALAHDIIEHPNVTNTNGYIDELMAIGAIIEFRLNEYNGLTPNRYRPLEEDDIINEIEFLLEGMDNIEIPSLRSRITNYQVVDVVEEASKSLYRELEKTISKENKKQVVYWVQRGIRLFKQRFRKASRHNLSIIWKQIEEKVDKFISNYKGEEGVAATLHISFFDGTTYLEEDYE